MIRTFILATAALAAIVYGSALDNALRAADDTKPVAAANSSGSSGAKTPADKAAQDKADADKLSALFDKLDANHDGQITSDEVPDDQRRLFERLLRRADRNGDGKLSREEFIAGMKDMEDRPADHPGDAAGRPNNGPPGGPPGAGNFGGGGFGGGGGSGGGPGGPGAFGGGFGGGGGPGPGPIMGIALFRALDTNGDGKLDAKEIAAAPEVLKKLANSNGEITREELLKSMPGALAGAGGIGAGGGFGFGGLGGGGGFGGAAGGQPGQGPPNPDALVKRILQQLDKNGDGKLQKDELPPRLQDRFDEFDTNHDGVLDEAEIKAILPRLIRRAQQEDGAAGAGAKGQDRPLRRLQAEAKADKKMADDKKTDNTPDKSDGNADQSSDKMDNK